MKTLAGHAAECEARLRAAGLSFGHGTDNARDEAVWLACFAAGIAPGDFAGRAGLPAGEDCAARLAQLTEKRIATRMPAAYLISEAWFAGRRFYVDRRAAVPRSHLGEWIADGLRPWLAKPPRAILDLCTGSGCIGIALAEVFPDARVTLSDVSADALAVAAENVRRHQLAARVRTVRCDLFDGLGGAAFDLIAGNPPYVNARAMAALPAEYRHEPALALAGGEDGADFLARILHGARRHLAGDGNLIVEAGSARGALERRFPRAPFTWLAASAADGEGAVFLLGAADLDAL